MDRMPSCAGRLLFGGDVCPVDSNRQLFEDGNAEGIFGQDILRAFSESEGLIFNLEAPLIDERHPITKSGSILAAPVRASSVFREMNALGIGLANNHILDQGIQGLESTFTALGAAGIPYFGAGASAADARRPLVVEVSGLKVGVYACAEHEFTIATETSGGANPFDPLISLGDISRLAREVDRVVVLYHGMKEFYRYPSPEVRKRCRAMVEAGANLVLCQHSHCIGCMEHYRDASILYGQGDFCFTKGDSNPLRATGLLVAYDPQSNAAECIPIQNDGTLVRPALGDDGDDIMHGFAERSSLIAQPEFVEREWARFCRDHADEYAEQIAIALQPAAISLLVRTLRKLGVAKFRFGEGTRIAPLLNMLQCEAHNEVLRTALTERLNGD